MAEMQRGEAAVVRRDLATARACYHRAHHGLRDWPRHSLYEECAGLRLLIEAGLLEAYVLLDQADPEIAEDYAPYRALVRRYIAEVRFGNLGQ